MVATNLFVLVSVIICLIVEICSSSKFDFKKVFKTPRENYEARIAELDKCEILERSSFSAEEEESKNSPPGSTPADPKVFVNAEVNVRFGGDSDTAKPKQNEPSSNHLLPSPQLPPYHGCFHHPYFPFHLGFNGPPYSQMHPPYHPCFGGWYNPYHYYYHPGFAPLIPQEAGAPYLHKPYPELEKDSACCRQNINEQPSNATQQLPPTTTAQPLETVTSKAPRKHRFAKDYGKMSNRKKMENRELTVDEWAAIAGLFDGNGEDLPMKPKRNHSASTFDCGESTTSPPEHHTTPTCTISTSLPSIKPKHECVPSKPPSHDVTLAGDIIIEKVEKTPCCKDVAVDRNCLHLSDKLEFIKINASHLGSFSYHVDDGDCSDGKVSRHIDDENYNDSQPIYDIDDVYRVKNNPIDATPGQILYPYSPNDFSFNPWWLQDNIKPSPSHGCDESVADQKSGR